MTKIINITQLQRNIGKITEDVQEQPYIVISKSQAKMLLLPYCDEWAEKIDDYIEAFYLEKDRSKLQKRYKESLTSGDSDLKII